MTARTSSAEPPSSAWMKLACFSDTRAVPTRKPRRPSSSITSPADSWNGTGLTNTEPAFCPPGWCSRRQRTISPIAASDFGPVARREAEGRREDDLVVLERGTTEAQGEPVSGHLPILPRHEVEDADPHQRRGHVRAVPAGVHAHRAAHRAGHADGPLQAGQRRGRGLAGEHRQRDGAARPRRACRRSRSPWRRRPAAQRGPGTHGRPRAGSSRDRRRAPGRRSPARHRRPAGGRRATRPRRTAPPDRRPGRWSTERAARRGSPASPRTAAAASTAATASEGSRGLTARPAPPMRPAPPAR